LNRSFAITFDYLCPFARNLNESVIEAIDEGAQWDVTFRPFSLAQTKVEDPDTDVWDRPPGDQGARGVRALQWGIAVRDGWPANFSRFHTALFAARHDRGLDIGDDEELAAVAETSGLDSVAIAEVVDGGAPRLTVQREHQELVAGWDVFGVPTVVVGDEAVFVRSMERHRPDEIARLLDLVSWTNLNEFKRTRVPR
jgi:predicted DsbA family dithiol-disulfide isomerase